MDSIDKNLLSQLTNSANSYAAAKGLQVETKQTSSSNSSSSYQCAPISLLPNAFPAKSFQNAKSLAPHFNTLVDRISRDGDFLKDTLAGGEYSVISKDEYTKKLLELYEDIYMNDGDDDEGDKSNFAKIADRLGIQRSDYMLNQNQNQNNSEDYELKQVELNTIAASFAGLAVNVAGLHRMMTQRYSKELKTLLDTNAKVVMGESYEPDKNTNIGVPTNPALDRLPLAMNVAHERYTSRFDNDSNSNSIEKAILFVVQEGETNTVDQRMLEFQLWTNHQIPVVRMSLTAAKDGLTMDDTTGALYIKNEHGKVQYEATVVYFRAGYAPTDYPDGYNGIEWHARELMERSRATKCPSLGYHLAGTKKVQQELARPGVLERFFTEEERKMPSGSDGGAGDDVTDGDGGGGEDRMTQMRGAFAGLYSLGEDAMEEDLAAIKEAIADAEGSGRYVLKPQREGGGYNYYGDDLAKKIKDNISISTSDNENANANGALVLGEDLAEFILMQRLFPPKQEAVLLRAGLVEGTGESISELGCFGTIVQSYDASEEPIHNEYAGFLLRTKFSNVDEGGVASGFATLSSPYLC